MRYRVAVDVGGTFTDLVALDLRTRRLLSSKVPSTPDSPSVALDEALGKAGIAPRDIETFFHGTTYGLNIILEHKGAEVALLTTKGFRDVLEIGRATWPMYSLHWRPPPPLVPRHRRFEVGERATSRGRVLVPLDEQDVVAALEAAQQLGIQTIAVCLLNAYAFTAHEERVAQICAERFPSLTCTVSHSVTRDYREYERTVTTVVEATIAARMRQYFEEIETFLASRAFDGTVMVTRADGGVMGLSEAVQRPVRTLTSGPASGVMGAAALARRNGHEHVVSIDMGGTSFDAALIMAGTPRLAPSTTLEHMNLLIPNIEIATIGAGGGSLARVDAAGGLSVGPESAGADPGPVSYMRGGTEPTFTDAALVSGLIASGNFLGGGMQLDRAAADAAVEELAGELGLDTITAAAGIVHVVEANMAALLESMTIEKGVDPRDYVLYAYGGGGPLVAASLAEQLGISRVVIPPYPGAFSAWGMLTLEIVHDFGRALFRPLEALDSDDLAAVIAELEAEARQVLDREGINEAARRSTYNVDLRYFGQEHTLQVELPAPDTHVDLGETLGAAFSEQHRLAYGYTLPESIELVGLRLRAQGSLDQTLRSETVPSSQAARTDAGKSAATRRVIHRGSGMDDECVVWVRSEHPAGAHVRGPAIIEEDSATAFVPRGWRALLDEQNLVLTNDNRGSE